ncbi:hypothetical protein F2P81_006101 [Scophthalmus maximus]|uniref:Uncharacterized protein n=1 Tax=Scophthalmus maximus TaxID=52904 RepID=A0A6A4TCH0_SCOMX|nr:hypothetical protein F2P81_006101 [Scophthalmus maximus]
MMSWKSALCNLAQVSDKQCGKLRLKICEEERLNDGETERESGRRRGKRKRDRNFRKEVISRRHYGDARASETQVPRRRDVYSRWLIAFHFHTFGEGIDALLTDAASHCETVAFISSDTDAQHSECTCCCEPISSCNFLQENQNQEQKRDSGGNTVVVTSLHLHLDTSIQLSRKCPFIGITFSGFTVNHGLEENIPTIEALIWAQRAVPQQPGAKFFPPAHRIEALVSQHPLLDERRIVGGGLRQTAMSDALFVRMVNSVNSNIRILTQHEKNIFSRKSVNYGDILNESVKKEAKPQTNGEHKGERLNGRCIFLLPFVGEECPLIVVMSMDDLNLIICRCGTGRTTRKQRRALEQLPSAESRENN